MSCEVIYATIAEYVHALVHTENEGKSVFCRPEFRKRQKRAVEVNEKTFFLELFINIFRLILPSLEKKQYGDSG